MYAVLVVPRTMGMAFVFYSACDYRTAIYYVCIYNIYILQPQSLCISLFYYGEESAWAPVVLDADDYIAVLCEEHAYHTCNVKTRSSSLSGYITKRPVKDVMKHSEWCDDAQGGAMPLTAIWAEIYITSDQ